MNMLNNASDYLSGNVNKGKAKDLAAESADVTIEDNWKGDIKAGAFAGLENPVSINTNDITGIEDGAFKDCKRLETLIMPNIERVGENVFEGCFSLHKVDVKDEDMARIVIEKIKACNLLQRIDIYIAGKFKISIKNNCEYLFGDRVSKLMEGNEISVPHYDFTGMAENVIASGTFKYRNSIEIVNADATTIVEDHALEDCREMREIHLSNVREIGANFCRYCPNLREITVKDETMANIIKKMLMLYNEDRSGDVSIYVEGQSDPFFKIKKDDSVVSVEKTKLIMHKVLIDYLNIDEGYAKYAAFSMGHPSKGLFCISDENINRSYIISALSLIIEDAGKSLPESEIESMVDKAMSEIDN